MHGSDALSQAAHAAVGMKETMDLNDLGFDGWFAEHSVSLLQPGQSIARVTAVDRGAFRVRNQDAEMYAELAGKFRFAAGTVIDLPCVGDWVCMQGHASSGPAIIHSALPRKTFLRRKCPGRTVDFQMIAANIDIAFIVQACGSDFNLGRLDRYMAMVSEGQAQPQVILSKADLISQEALKQIIAQINQSGVYTPVLALSNSTGAGLDAFRAFLAPGKTYCLLGSSGVGKTTLINRLIGYDALETKAVSETGEGVHTTTRRQLLLLDSGAMLIDTPGMREMGLLETGDGVDDTFADFGEYSENCRFANCTHTGEPGCAVFQAVANGMLSEDRYQSFLKLKKEVEYHDLSYEEKRRKDKTFGRFIKSAKKSMRDGYNGTSARKRKIAGTED